VVQFEIGNRTLGLKLPGIRSKLPYATRQYGLRKLVEHIWMLIGMARSCQTMRELRDRMAMQFGREPFLLNMYIPAQPKQLPPGNPPPEIT
jgi:hypothetical protein